MAVKSFLSLLLGFHFTVKLLLHHHESTRYPVSTRSWLKAYFPIGTECTKLVFYLIKSMHLGLGVLHRAALFSLLTVFLCPASSGSFIGEWCYSLTVNSQIDRFWITWSIYAILRTLFPFSVAILTHLNVLTTRLLLAFVSSVCIRVLVSSSFTELGQKTLRYSKFHQVTDIFRTK